MSTHQTLKTLCIALLTAIITVTSSHAQRQVKVKPVLNKDKESNDILEHIANNFLLTIPNGRTLDSIENDICCNFRIGPEGQLLNFRVVNQANAREIVEFKSAPTLDIWIQVAILDGMRHVPPCPPKLRRSSRLHTIVFSFGLSRPDPTTLGKKTLGFNAQGIAQQIQESYEKNKKEMLEQRTAAEKSWFEYTDTNIKESIRPKQSLTLPELPTINQPNPLRTPDALPPTQSPDQNKSTIPQQTQITIQLQ